MSCLATIGAGLVLGGKDEQGYALEVHPVYATEWPILGEVLPLPPSPTPTVDTGALVELYESTVTEGVGRGGATAMPYPPTEGPEGVICAYFWDDCEHALRVFACGAGPDYIDGSPFDSYIGAAQIDIGLHAWRFNSEPYELGENMRVARQLYDERGWAPWPVCRYR
mgnify:CR=1 FL=1